MKIDYEKLAEQLKNLTGNDYINAEREERLAGNVSAAINFTAGFQSRLAAKALGTNARELQNLPLSQFTRVTSEVSAFLFGGSDEDTTETPEETSQKTPSEK